MIHNIKKIIARMLVSLSILSISFPVETVFADSYVELEESMSESSAESSNDDKETNSEDTHETNWVYDESQSISEETISLINSLNENELKVNQYGVVIVKSMNGQSMDRFKLELFNTLGVGHLDVNAGILLVIATEDREYGIEIGDGLQGQAREVFEADIVGKLTMDELKAGDWNGAVYKVSNALPKIISIQELDIISGSDYPSPQLLEGDYDYGFYALIAAVALSAIPAFALLWYLGGEVLELIEAKYFMKSDYVKSFIDINGFTNKSLKNELYNSGYYTLDRENLYRYSLNKITKELYEIYPEIEIIDEDVVKKAYPYSEFEKNARSSFKRNTANVKRKYDVHLAEEYRKFDILNQHVKQNKVWAEEIVREEGMSEPGILQVVFKYIEELPKIDKEELREWMINEEKAMLVEYEVYKLFDNKEDAERILKDIRDESGYKRYISGEHDREYFNENNKRDNSLVNSSNYWLWIYGINHRNRRIRAERDRSNYSFSSDNSSSSSNSGNSSSFGSGSGFGTGFRGGFSSGGGSSGKF